MKVVKQLMHFALMAPLFTGGTLYALSDLTDQAILNKTLTQASAFSVSPSISASLQKSPIAAALVEEATYQVEQQAPVKVVVEKQQQDGSIVEEAILATKLENGIEIRVAGQAVAPVSIEVQDLFSKPMSSAVATAVPEAIPESEAAPKIQVVKNNIQIAVQKHMMSESTIVEPASPLNADLLQQKTLGVIVAEQAKDSHITISNRDGVLAVTPAKLDLTQPEVVVKLQDTQLSFDSIQIFIRDPNLAHWNSLDKKILMDEMGASEIYVVANGQMVIVPFSFGSKKQQPSTEGLVAQLDQKFQNLPGLPDFKIPEVLTDIQAVVGGGNNASYSSSQEAAQIPEQLASNAPTDANTSQIDSVNDDYTDAATSAEKQGISVAESRTQTAISIAKQAALSNRYQIKVEDAAYQTLNLQIVDERSVPDQNVIYPLPNMDVRINGAEFSSKTDASGHVTFRDVPVGARLLVEVSDPEGYVRNTVYELQTFGSSQGVVRLKAVRQYYFDALTTILKTAQRADLSSFCGHVYTSGTDTKSIGASGIQVALDIEAEGPYYFNEFGYLDLSMRSTGADGRFCYINADPGPAAVSLYKEDHFVSTQTVGLFAGRHTEEQYNIDETIMISTHLAAMPSAHDQLSQDRVAANAHTLVDMIDLIPLGTDTLMSKINDGEVQTTLELIPSKGRVFSFAQASEFEPVVYAMPAQDHSGVVPLIPRGFLEDLSYYAQVSYDPTLGSVILEHAAYSGQEHQSVNIKLLNMNGQPVGEAWYYADSPNSKAVFFNVPAGVYTVLVETTEGFWLASDTVFVYSEATSYVRTGSPLIYNGQPSP